MPAEWVLQDVQAGVNVVITVLSTLAIFIFTRTSWESAAGKISRGREVPLTSLVSLNTIGEAFDAILLLKGHLSKRRYLDILAQCIVVVLLSVSALLSGLVDRYAARRGTVIREQLVTGFLASSAWTYEGMDFATAEWNRTYPRLDKAHVPLNQLLDFLPDNDIDWLFDSTQWNNSWTMDCANTPTTARKLEATGNCNSTFDELPGLATAFSFTKYDSYARYWNNLREYDTIKDAYINGIAHSVSVLLAAIHIHNNSANLNSTTTSCAIGTALSSSYTKTECRLTRHNRTSSSPLGIALPDVSEEYITSLPRALTSYYGARLVQESASGTSITIIQPAELIRFFQAYTVVKDTQDQHPVTRPLDVNLRVVQVSAAFLVVVSLACMLILAGVVKYAVFAIRHRDAFSGTPQSKVEWMVQSIQANTTITAGGAGGDGGGSTPLLLEGSQQQRRSVTIAPDLQRCARTSSSRRKFEAAAYGANTAGAFPPRQSMSTLASSASIKHFGGVAGAAQDQRDGLIDLSPAWWPNRPASYVALSGGKSPFEDERRS